MIEQYMEIGEALTAAKDLKWIDIAPRVESHTNLYPAAYINILPLQPANLIGGSTFTELEFEIEIWIKPYEATTAKPLSPVLNKLSDKMGLIRVVRRAIFNHEGQWVQSTTLVSESSKKQPDGFFKVVQRWKATTDLDPEELVRIQFPDQIEMEIENGAD